MFPTSEHFENTFFGITRVGSIKEKQIQSFDNLKTFEKFKTTEKFAQFWLPRGENLAH